MSKTYVMLSIYDSIVRTLAIVFKKVFVVSFSLINQNMKKTYVAKEAP